MRSQQELDAFIRELREAHWALREPLRYAGMRQLLVDQDIALASLPLPVPAMTTIQWGIAAIAVNSSLRGKKQTAVLAEEYAHAMLHREELGELTVHLAACDSTDPREFEADYVARCLLAGPGISVDWTEPPAAPMLIEAPASRIVHDDRIGPPQTPAPYHISAELVAPYRPRPHRKVPSVLDALIPRPRFTLQSTPDDDRIRYLGEKRFSFEDVEGRRWTVYDFALYMVRGRSRRKQLQVGDESAAVRVFVNAAGVQRRYYFTRLELHRIAVKHFDRQLREGKIVEPRQVAQERTGS